DGHVRGYTVDDWRQLWETKDGGGKFAAVAVAPDGKTGAVTFKDGVRFLDAATGKARDVLEGEGGGPIAVAYLPLESVAPGVIAHNKVIFGNVRGYYHKTWRVWPNVATIETASAAGGKQSADQYAVPLAAAPDGRWAVLTIGIDDTGKPVLRAWW